VKALGALVVIVGAVTSARAEPCTLDGVRAEVAALGGTFDDARVRVELERLEGRITFVTAAGELVGPRVVRAATCAELATSIALVIVMSAPHDDVIEATPTETVERIDAPPAVVRALPPRATRRWEAIAGGAGDASARGALELGVRMRRGWYSLGIGAHVDAPQTVDVGGGGVVHVERALVEVAPCVHLWRGALCGLAASGIVVGGGEHLARSAGAARPALQLGARAELAWPLWSRIALRVHVDALENVTRAQFLVDRMPVWSSPAQELWIGGGVVTSFP